MSKLMIYSLILLGSVLLSSVSQIMLKISAKKTYENKIKEYLNPFVISAYTIFILCTLISMYALKVVPLSMSPILESSGYIFVTALSFFVLKERMNKKQILGMILILIGIVTFSI